MLAYLQLALGVGTCMTEAGTFFEGPVLYIPACWFLLVQMRWIVLQGLHFICSSANSYKGKRWTHAHATSG